MKFALSFLAGVLAMAAVVYLTGARLAAPMFFAGVVAVIAPGVAVLSSVDRVRSVARFLNSFADAWQGNNKRRPEAAPVRAMPDPSGYRKPSRKQQQQITRDTAAEYLGDDADDIFGVSPSRRAS